jgi:hypothetical protein
MKILSLLFLIRHTIPTWYHPTSGFSAFLTDRAFSDLDEPLEAIIETFE